MKNGILFENWSDLLWDKILVYMILFCKFLALWILKKEKYLNNEKGGKVRTEIFKLVTGVLDIPISTIL